MDILLYNASWMKVNLELALIAVLLSWLWLSVKQPIVRLCAGALWLLFLPNTIYLLTDVQYLPQQILQVSPVEGLVLFAQYGILIAIGVLTFFYSLHAYEVVKEGKKRKRTALIQWQIIILNFAIGFAVFLGKIERTESWDVLVNIPKFFTDSLHLLASPTFLLFSFLGGIFCNLLYFGLYAFLHWRKYL